MSVLPRPLTTDPQFSSPSVSGDRWLPLFGVVALWIPAMIAASYEWGHGEYYSYGWFVPPAAAWLLFRRWQEKPGPVTLLRRGQVLVVCVPLIAWVTGLRILGYADPSWRLPMELLGVTAALGGHAIIAATRGFRVSSGFVWITLFLLSALPWPSVVESGIVHGLTRGVVTVVAEVFQLFGKPVELMGDQLQLNGMTVEVTDGCSGVRSFQSFFMATWFFAELQRLRASRAMILLACACAVAFLVNGLRTYALAQIRFGQGEMAFHRAHDFLGFVAFGVSGVVFYFLSARLSHIPRGTLVKTIQKGDKATSSPI